MNSPAFMENLKQLFAECDTNNNGCLGRQEFSELCSKIGLSKDAANETFDRLDIDKNDRITFDEFAAGFNQYKQTTSISNSATNQASNLKHTSSPDARPSGSQIPKPPPRSPTTSRNQKPLAATSGAGPVSSRIGRKSASPLGVMSLSSAGSSSSTTNMATAQPRSRSGSGSGSVSVSSANVGDVSEFSTSAERDAFMDDGIGKQDSMVVYSSDMIKDDYDQAACSSGQFGSLMSSSGSFSQLRSVQDLLNSVQKLQSENQILTQIFFKDKREREEYISQLGEEFDQQVREVEERANKRAKEELENEKRRLREMMQAERETLQHHYQTIENMSKLIKSAPNGKLGADESETSIDKVRSKLEDTYLENRQLKKSLLDTKSDVAMIWKEMEKLKRQYEDKLSNAYERNNETRSECDHIKQQLNLMKDSNRKLQDASDVITNYITDKVEPVIKGAIGEDGDNPNYLSPGGGPSLTGSSLKLGVSSQSNSRKGSILSEYLNNGQSNSIDDQCHSASMNDSGDLESMASSQSGQRAIGGRLNEEANKRLSAHSGSHYHHHHHQATPKPPARTNSSSSNVSDQARLRQRSESSRSGDLGAPNSRTSRDVDEESMRKGASSSKVNAGSGLQQQQQSLRNSAKSNSISGNNLSSTIDFTTATKQQRQQRESNAGSNQASEITSKQPIADQKSGLKGIGRHFFIGSRAQSDAQVNAKDETIKTNVELANKKAFSVDNIDEIVVEPADGPSKATFNIILVGDSFVGKSSFAARFMEGSFVQGLISNCSIDFKTKAYKVDGINYTVNLWDTAGQERFRSITASYFRKADGIILMYDVTDKRSYLNVRNWMSTISDTAAENVAVLLIGNKIDLRQKSNKEKCVPTEEGHRLAKEYDIVFLETSVKTGTNLVPSMGKLIRLIAKNNTPVEEDTDRIRLNDKTKSFNCMPKNC